MRERPGSQGRNSSGAMDQRYKHISGVWLGVSEKLNVSQYSCSFPSQSENSEWECCVFPVGWAQAFCSFVSPTVLCSKEALKNNDGVNEWRSSDIGVTASWFSWCAVTMSVPTSDAQTHPHHIGFL